MEFVIVSFVILGNASGGTSFCSYVMDAHPQIECPFEEFFDSYKGTIDHWHRRQSQLPEGVIYGTKVPFEEVILRHWRWSIDEVIALVDEFDVIFNWRSFEQWRASWNDRQSPKLDPTLGYRWWNAGWEILLQMRHRRPGKVIVNNYERLRGDLATYAPLMYEHVGVDPSFIPPDDLIQSPKYQ